MPILHTTRPPNDDTFIVRICATASQMDPTVGWSAVGLTAITTKGKYCQSPTMKWGAAVVSHNGIWHITQTPDDDAPSCWLLASDMPELIARGMAEPQAPAAGPDLAPELEAARAELARVRAAIAKFVEAAK